MTDTTEICTPIHILQGLVNYTLNKDYIENRINNLLDMAEEGTLNKIIRITPKKSKFLQR